MKTFAVALWNVEVDPDKTALVYQGTTRGSPTDCSCDDCRNFAQVGEKAFPEAFHQILLRLGIDYQKAAEVYSSADGFTVSAE